MFILKAAISLYGTQTACPVCRNCIDETDIMPLSGNLLFIYIGFGNKWLNLY
jgi:hypothetical protein